MVTRLAYARPVVSVTGNASGAPDADVVGAWLEQRLGKPVFVAGHNAPTHEASSLIVRVDGPLALRIKGLRAGDLVFDTTPRLGRFLLGETFGVCDLDFITLHRNNVDPYRGIAELLELLVMLNENGVESVSADYVYELPESGGGSFVPDDPHYILSNQWYLWAIRARFAWRYVHASPAVVAVIDTGVDLDHDDLECNLWTNPEDGSHGKDVSEAATDPTYPMDTNGHGTHIAGTIAAVGNNASGVTGVCWQAEIMPVRIAEGLYVPDIVSQMAQAVDWAIDHGASIINVSYVVFGDHDATRAAFQNTCGPDVLIVASSGNSSETGVYPAAYDFDHVLSVMGVDQLYEPFLLSDLDPDQIDIAAPAQQIYSAAISQNGVAQYSEESGVSMATAVVSGAAALLKGHPDYASMTAVQLKDELINNARKFDSLTGLCVAEGVLDLEFVTAPTGGSVWDVVSGPLDFPNANNAVGKVADTTTGVEVELEFCGDGDLRHTVHLLALNNSNATVTIYGKRIGNKIKVVSFTSP